MILLLFTADTFLHHLLIVEVHIKVTVENQWSDPRHSPQGQEDGAIIRQEVQQVLLSLGGTYHAI